MGSSQLPGPETLGESSRRGDVAAIFVALAGAKGRYSQRNFPSRRSCSQLAGAHADEVVRASSRPIDEQLRIDYKAATRGIMGAVRNGASTGKPPAGDSQ